MSRPYVFHDKTLAKLAAGSKGRSVTARLSKKQLTKLEASRGVRIVTDYGGNKGLHNKVAGGTQVVDLGGRKGLRRVRIV